MKSMKARATSNERRLRVPGRPAFGVAAAGVGMAAPASAPAVTRDGWGRIAVL